MGGSCMFSKEKLRNEKIKSAVANTLGLAENDIHIVEESEDWIKRNNRPVVIEYNGFLDDEDDKEEKYYGYHYYDIWYDNMNFEEKLVNLEKEFKTEVIIDME